MNTTPLLLLPGLLCDSRLWHDQIAALQPSRPVSVADLGQDDTMAGMAARVLASAPPLFDLAGLSMGGYAALAILAAAPARVRRLCLLDTSARPDSPEAVRRRRGMIALVRNEKPEHFRGVTPRLLPQMLHPENAARADLAEAIGGMAMRIGRDGFLRQQQAILSRPDSRPMLAGIQQPVLVMVGEADQVTPPGLAEEIANSVPAGRLEVLAGCGHLPPLERPEIVSEMMLGFLS